MKKININLLNIFFLFFAGAFLFTSCEEDEKSYPRTRMFQPVLNEDMEAIDNTIVVDLGKMKEAESYLFEMSRDSFATAPIYSFTADTNYVVVDEQLLGEELLWYTIYQVRVTAIANDEQYNSLPSLLGSVRTAKYPSNMGVPGEFDVTDHRARVYWTKAGDPITSIRVFAIEDERLTNPLMEFEVTDTDRLEEEKIIAGLDPATEYQIALYSEGQIRGWEQYMTKEALATGPNVYDLSGIDNPDILADTLPDVVDGAIIYLEAGRVYNAAGYEFSDKSVSIRSGYGFVPQFPRIDCSSNYNMVDGAAIDSITFERVELSGSFDGNYIFNISNSATVGEIKFEGCNIRSLRGVMRIKGGTGTLDKYTLNNCMVDSINGYGILTVDQETWMVNDILIQNSTIAKAQVFMQSRNNSNSVVIESCTISEAPEAGRQMFRWRTGGQDNVINGITISNTIWGHGWNMDGEESYGVDGFDGLGDTNFNVVNTYATTDFSFADGRDQIPGFPSVTYSGPADALWIDPYVDLNFNFLDTGFSGKGDSGDPRWRMGL